MRTHPSITNEDLRTMFARELLTLRYSYASMKTQNISLSSDFKYGYRFGLDTTYRRMQYYLDTGKMPELRLRR